MSIVYEINEEKLYKAVEICKEAELQADCYECPFFNNGCIDSLFDALLKNHDMTQKKINEMNSLIEEHAKKIVTCEECVSAATKIIEGCADRIEEKLKNDDGVMCRKYTVNVMDSHGSTVTTYCGVSEILYTDNNFTLCFPDGKDVSYPKIHLGFGYSYHIEKMEVY